MSRTCSSDSEWAPGRLGARGPKTAAAIVTGVLLAAAELSAAPRLECERPVYDFGEVEETQDKVVHTFRLRNAGDAELRIQNVRTSCGCTTTRLSRDTVAPGGEFDLGAEFDLRGRSGSQNKNITIQSNDPAAPSFRLELRGRIRKDVDVQPDGFYLEAVSADAAIERSVEIAIAQGQTVRITGLETNRLPAGTAELEALEAGHRYRVTLALPAHALRAQQRLSGHIGVRTDHPRHPLIVLPVTAVVRKEFVAIPSDIVIAEATTTQRVTCVVSIRSRSGHAFEVTKVQPPADDVQTQTQGDAGGQCRIRFTNLAATRDMDGRVCRVTVRGWNGETNVLAIPVRVEAPARPAEARPPMEWVDPPPGL